MDSRSTTSSPDSSPNLVSAEDLEARLELVRAQVSDPVAGLYGPDSLVWEVNREAVIFVGSGRAALLQLAHPYVAEAIDQHSNTRADPFGRFYRTFRNVFAMVYGDLDSALASARAVHRVHTSIRGEISEDLGAFPAGHIYQANEPHALLWVHATLWETSVAVYEQIVRPLRPEEKERYYRETKLFGYLFGLDDDTLPATWLDFVRYNEEMWASECLTVGLSGREIGHFLFRPHRLGTGAAFRWLELMTTGLLPERLREAFGLPFGSREKRRFERSLRLLRRLHRWLPRRARFVPPYIAGLRRARGIKRRDLLGELLMRLWLGPGRSAG